MARRTRTYVAFDADSDIHYYRLMQAWKAHDHIDFDFNDAHDLTTIRQTSSEEAIKNSLRERMRNSKIFVLLVGEKTKGMKRYVPWETEIALKADLPIIVVNLNGKRQLDQDRCPTKVVNELALHIAFGQDIMQTALDKWQGLHETHRKNGKTGAYSYGDDAYP